MMTMPEFEGMNAESQGTEENVPPVLKKASPILARVLLVGAMVLFLLMGSGLVALIRRGGSEARNVPALLFAGNRSTNVAKLPELSSWTTKLSEQDVAFGRQQVAQMVKDRPEMGRSVYETDAIWQFCVRAFGGAAIGEPILWNNSMPEGDGYRADHMGPYQGAKGYIRIRKVFGTGENRGKPLLCEELWAGVVFEIENMRNTAAFNELYTRAIHGQLSREEWILENTKLEYGALRRGAGHYAQLWRPLTRSRQISNTPYLWGCSVPKTYEAWISLYSDPKGYPSDVFGRYYDESITPYLASVERWRKAQRASH